MGNCRWCGRKSVNAYCSELCQGKAKECDRLYRVANRAKICARNKAYYDSTRVRRVLRPVDAQERAAARAVKAYTRAAERAERRAQAVAARAERRAVEARNKKAAREAETKQASYIKVMELKRQTRAAKHATMLARRRVARAANAGKVNATRVHAACEAYRLGRMGADDTQLVALLESAKASASMGELCGKVLYSPLGGLLLAMEKKRPDLYALVARTIGADRSTISVKSNTEN